MDKNEFIILLEERFKNNMHRHPNHNWNDVLKRLNDDNVKSLTAMELSGGEIDIVDLNNNLEEFIFVDCSKESPNRRSLCYDQEALEMRKANKPKDSVINLANNMNVTILNEVEYRKLQTFEDFDLKTSSWILTPKEVRDLGGALFCDNRYKKVFTYHNGADSYYGARGFRAKFKI